MVSIYSEIKCSSGDEVVTTGSGLVPSPGMEGGLSKRRAVSESAPKEERADASWKFSVPFLSQRFGFIQPGYTMNL